MDSRQYAVVAYLDGELAAFASRVRRELAPGQESVRPHITALHPRALLLQPAAAETATAGSNPRLESCLSAAEQEACAVIEEASGQLAPIRVSLGEVRSFAPAHPTIYLAVEDGARHLRYLHDLLKRGPLAAADVWEHVPHLTLATLPDAAAAVRAAGIAAAQWRAYAGPRQCVIRELTLVREEAPNCWLDLHQAALGG